MKKNKNYRIEIQVEGTSEEVNDFFNEVKREVRKIAPLATMEILLFEEGTPNAEV